MTIQNEDDYAYGFSAPLELKFSDAASTGEFSGLAAAFGGAPDSHGDVIQPGAFASSLAEHRAAGSSPALLWHHNQSRPVGTILGLHEDHQQGLMLQGKLNLGTSAGRDAHAHLREGSSRGLSIGYTVAPGGSARKSDGTRVLSKLSVHEISLTPMPSNPRTVVTGVKTMLACSGDIERVLRNGGVPSRLASKIAALGSPAVTGQTFNPDLDLDRLAEVLREQSREIKSWNN